MNENEQGFIDDIPAGTTPQVSKVFVSAEEIKAAREENEGSLSQSQETNIFEENAQEKTENSGSVEKINLSEIRGLKAEMEFDEEIEKVKNDKQTGVMAYRYLKSHQEELKKVFKNNNITFDE